MQSFSSPVILLTFCFFIFERAVVDTFTIPPSISFSHRFLSISFTSGQVRSSSCGVGPLLMASQEPDKKIKGDSLREATGIRPSLHPTVINAIAEALKMRCSGYNDGMPLRVTKGFDDVKPLDVAIAAGKIASKAIEKRQSSSKQDGMELTAKEQQTIAGRILGIIMRFDELESMLNKKVSSVGWISKYNEWGSFGILDGGEAMPKEGELDELIEKDPLFCMNRAECLLALYLNSVEIPQLSKINEEVPDASAIDFLDSDRKEVLIGDFL